MKEYQIILIIKGESGRTRAPNKFNPVKAKDLPEVLKQLADHLTNNQLVELLGAQIVQIGD